MSPWGSEGKNIPSSGNSDAEALSRNGPSVPEEPQGGQCMPGAARVTETGGGGVRHPRQVALVKPGFPSVMGQHGGARGQERRDLVGV